MTNTGNAPQSNVMAGWRFYLGVALFTLGLIGPVIIIPLVTSLGFSAATKTSISGCIVVGADILLILAAGVMGKSGYAYIKSRTFAFLKQQGPPKRVGRVRYKLGLAMFTAPIVFGWLAPYTGSLIPSYAGNKIKFAIIGDLFLLGSLFVLGGDFWEKLRGLFIHDAKAVLLEP